LNKKWSTALSQIHHTTQVMMLIVTSLGSFMILLDTSIVMLRQNAPHSESAGLKEAGAFACFTAGELCQKR